MHPTTPTRTIWSRFLEPLFLVFGQGRQRQRRRTVVAWILIVCLVFLNLLHQELHTAPTFSIDSMQSINITNTTSTPTTTRNKDMEEEHTTAPQEFLQQQAPPPELGTPGDPPCRVAVENKMDYHYEVIESTILKYPIPWYRLNCSTSTVIVFDVALAENHYFYLGATETGTSLSKSSYVRYFNTVLSGTIRRRSDGTRAQFGRVVQYSHYYRHPEQYNYHAFIGVSCDSYKFQPWLQNRPRRHYCVLHGTCPSCTPQQLETGQVCWVTPLMHPARHFLPSDLPQFDANNHNAIVVGYLYHSSSYPSPLTEHSLRSKSLPTLPLPKPQKLLYFDFLF